MDSSEATALGFKDFDKVSLSPDMFNTGKLNVFFFDEEIGTVEETRGMWLAIPYGIAQGTGSHSKEGAIKHLLEVRSKSIAKKEVLTVAKNQTSLF